MFWRLFVDARFATHFTLTNLTGSELESHEGISVVKPYPEPTDAGTERARSAEAALIQKLGGSLFYDPVRGAPPIRPLLVIASG